MKVNQLVSDSMRVRFKLFAYLIDGILVSDVLETSTIAKAVQHPFVAQSCMLEQSICIVNSESIYSLLEPVSHETFYLALHS